MSRLGLLACALVAAAAPGRPAPVPAAGRYVLHGTAQVDAPGIPMRDGTVSGDAVVKPGGRDGAVLVQVTSGRYSCELAGTLAEAGDLTFANGQTCELEVGEPAARGRVLARLRSGTGRVTPPGALELELMLEVNGRLATRPAGDGVVVLGTTVSLPWSPEVPVQGTVRLSAAGRRVAAAP